MPFRSTLLLVCLLFTCAACGDDAPPPLWTHKATVLEKVPTDRPVKFWFHDGVLRHAFVSQVTGGVALVVDGVPGPTCKALAPEGGVIKAMAFNGDGGNDEPQSTILERVHVGPQGGRVAAQAWMQDDRHVLLVDGKEGPAFDEVFAPVFDDAGSSIAYVGRKGDTLQVIVDGKVAAQFPTHADEDTRTLSDLAFSADGSTVGFVERVAMGTPAQRARAWIGGAPLPHPWFHDVTHFTWAPAGAKHAYIAIDVRPTARMRMVRDGAIGPSFDDIRNPTYSPDGLRLAYYGRRAEGSGLILDNVPQTKGSTDIVGAPIFSPDGTHVAYIASTDGGWHVVLNGKPEPTQERVSQLRFAPDGTTPVYVTQQGAAMRWMLGREAGPDAIQVWPIHFSEDGRHHAYRCFLPGDVYALVENGTLRTLGTLPIERVELRPGGAGVGYVQVGSEGARVVLEGEVGPKADAIEPTGPLFLDGGRARYVARRGGDFVLVTATRR